MGELVLDRLTVGYGGKAVVTDFSLRVPHGQRVSLLGPSGAGKTSLLKVIAGLLRPQSGRVLIDGRPVHHLPPEKTSAVMMFQKPLLFPFMDVAQNVGFGLRMRGRLSRRDRQRIDAILALTQLKGFNRRRVHELSGGQQQRVSLARALVIDPAVLLLDEPLSNLDATLRQEMRELLITIQEETGTTMLMVTHDQSEALVMSHQVSLLLDGRLRQHGSPQELFRHPLDPDVARFFGNANLFTGRREGGHMASAYGRFPVPPTAGQGRLMATIRPENLQLSVQPAPGGRPGTVVRTSFEGSVTRVWVACGEETLVALSDNGHFKPGQRVGIHIPSEKVWVFPRTDPPSGAEPLPPDADRSGGRP
jgi:ABC-type Fe3+/spermidine/putrescine transport system ATPase subunit